MNTNNKIDVKSKALTGQRVIKVTHNGEDMFLPVGLSSVNPNGGGGGEIGASMAFYKCTAVDTGMAYDDYQNANVSGVTSPTEINGEFASKDPMALDNNRVFTKDGYTLGYDKKNTAWCITEADSLNYINSIFYSKVEGLSTEEGTLTNPLWWDSEGVATSDRTITGSYNLNEGQYNDEWGSYDGWCFYVKLKAGTAYTIGINVPADNEEEGTGYDPYLYLKDTNDNQLASGTRTDTGMTLTYTPAADGVFIIQAMEEYNSVSTPITCSPAPEESVNPPEGLFEQTGWKVGAGIAPGFNVVSAGLAEYVQRFNLIEGDGFGLDSVWQSEDGTLFVFQHCSYGGYYAWSMGPDKDTPNTFRYQSDRWSTDTNPFPHPATVVWNYRSSSSYGDYPVLELAPQSGVSGTPTVTPIAIPGRDEVGYAEWSGKLMEQNTETGAWSESETVKTGMKAYNWTPAPGGYYSEDGNAVSTLYRGFKGSVYGWGASAYLEWGGSSNNYASDPVKGFEGLNFKQIKFHYMGGYALDADGYLWCWGKTGHGSALTGDSVVPVKVSDVKFTQIATGSEHLCALDTDGYLWSVGNNTYGQLGDGTTSSKSALTKIGDKKWSFVYCTDRTTIALDDSGIMWGVGQGNNYRFGNSSTDNLTTLTKLNDKVWRSVWGNDNHTFAIDTDGYLWGAGSSSNGSLGTGGTTTEKTFVQIGKQKWQKVATASGHTIAINTEGFLYGWGANSHGQLGLGEGYDGGGEIHHRIGDKKWTDISASSSASGGIDEYGQAFWWGGGSSYLTPFSAYTPQKIPVPGKCYSIVYKQSYSAAFVLTDE